ncbi:Haloacid dehalogenase-like hydrolase domain-containing protein [Porphyridium purpureum]|uniref:Haloacid dehalogenase-like hydrolase domain-containing protein n=1 Tax=Porphyridium purpureum TaxID=35688 RepID=A0A5J4YUI3_PORPP|nr:Haloacid dehalogenase-like hydrolase domain-containing protein [Porphyridium purpureum]|eukprot:POR3520..scf227_4
MGLLTFASGWSHYCAARSAAVSARVSHWERRCPGRGDWSRSWWKRGSVSKRALTVCVAPDAQLGVDVKERAEGAVNQQVCGRSQVKKMDALRGIIFDMDNTLTTDGHIDFAEMRRRARIPQGVDILYHLESLSGTDRAACEQAIHEVEVESHKAMELSAGCVRCLERIREHEETMHSDQANSIALHQRKPVRMAILTRNSTASVQVFLDRFGLNNRSDFTYFDAIMARDSVAGVRPKPAADAINYLCEQWQLNPQECIMIGDDVIDIQTGQNARCGATMLLKYPRNQPYWHMADYAVNDLDQAADILLELISPRRSDILIPL